MKRSTKRASDARKKQTTLAVTILAASVLAIGGLGVYVAQSQRPPTGADGCRIGQTVPDAHTIVLIDQTDKLNDDQLLYVRTLILQEYMRLGIYDRFSVVGLAADVATPATVAASDKRNHGNTTRNLPNFSRCRIQAGSEADWTTQNPDQIGRRFQQLVGSELAKTVGELKNVPPALTSPILETIDRLAQSTTFGSPQIRRRLVVISDLAQHTPDGVSHYPPAGARFAYTGGAPLSAGDLSGMSVRVHYVSRDDLKSIQNPDHRAYWTDFFKQSGAIDVAIGWGLSPDPENDALSPVRDFTSAGASGALFKPDHPQPLVAEPALVSPVEPETTGSAPSMPAPPRAAVESPYYSVEGYIPPGPVRVTRLDVNIRQWPLANSTTPIHRKAQRNEQLSIVGIVRQADGIWYQVVLQDGREGFVRSDLTSAPTPTPITSIAPLPTAPSASPAPTAAPVKARTGPRRLASRAIAYPADAARKNEEGDVAMRLCVDDSGIVTQVAIERSSGSRRLDDASVAWAWQQRFAAATEDGQPVGVCNHPLTQQWKLD